MGHTKHAIFITIYKIFVKGKKKYIVPSVDTLIDLICSRHATEIHRRWAFQCLHDLEAWGYIKRRERYIKTDEGNWKQIPSLISITLAGARKLCSLGVDSAAALVNEILSWMHCRDKRFPAYKPPATSPAERLSTGGLTAIGALLGDFRLIPG